MGRRYRNRESSFFELVETIATIHYSFGLAITMGCLGIVGLIPWWFGGLESEMVKRLLIDNTVPYLQLFFLGMAIIAFLATMYNLWVNRFK